MERLLLDWSVRAALIVAATGVVAGILKPHGPWAIHRIWTAALAAMLVLPAWRAWGPSVETPILQPLAHPPTFAAPLPHEAESLPGPRNRDVAPALPPQPESWRPDPNVILLALYASGVALMLARLLLATLRVRAIMRAARPVEDACFTAVTSAPIVAGWLRPVVLLPEHARQWPPSKLEAVLLHEREHVRRRDPLVQWLALFNRCLFWFHPLAWWLERKLAALSEDACDAAVLARGCRADEYATYLIEIARSVTAGETRMHVAGALPFAASNLPRRIRRIMDGPVSAPASRLPSAAAFALCACQLTAVLACSPSRRVLPRTDDMELSMAEQSRRAEARLQQRQLDRGEGDAALWKAALSLKPESARSMETAIKASPEDSVKLLDMVVRFHESRKDWQALDALTLWFASEHPETRVDWGHRPQWDQVWDKEGFQPVRDVWARQLAKPWRDPFVYMNAAEYLSGSDNQLAEQSLLEGQRRFPRPGLHWEVLLARHYARAVTAGADDAYARRVRQTLLASKDTELLMRTVEQLQRSNPNADFSQSLIERTLSVEPENRSAHGWHVGTQFAAAEYRAQQEPGKLTDGDRMLIFESKLARRWRARLDDATAEATARELLALASRNTKDPSYGAAILLSNLALGEAGFIRGDRAEAVRDLLAASAAPPTEYTRYQQIDMTLARQLVDAGERASVAKFLDACARFNIERKALSDWAALLRQGLNPNIFPARATLQ